MNPYDRIIDALNQRGWIVTDSAISAAWCAGLRAEAQQLWDAGEFQAGEIGQTGDGHQPRIRGDAICWVRPGSAIAAMPFFAWMTQFRQELNARFRMGLHGQEFHFARYPSGAGYNKHLDQHRGISFRRISVVLYLNERWDADGGGELCLYDTYDPEREIGRFLPVEARLAVFVSGRTPHAVLPARATRWSIAGWLRTDQPAALP